MPHLTIQNSPNGPLLDVIIGVSTARAAILTQTGQPIPNQIQIRALVDTGASGTCIDPSVLQLLALSPTGMASMLTPSTGHVPQSCATYDVSLAIRHPFASLKIGTVPVMESHLQLQGIQGLIGRDVLGMCVLIYNGAAGFFTLAY